MSALLQDRRGIIQPNGTTFHKKGTFCFNGCGCGCDIAQFREARDFAIKMAEEMAEEMGEGWKGRVHENGNWHASVTFMGGVDCSITSGKAWNKPYGAPGTMHTCFMNLKSGQVIGKGSTPKAAFENTSRAALEKINSMAAELSIMGVKTP